MTRATRIEGRVQSGIMLLMGGVAGAASFKHIHDLAVTYGQPSLIGWANAIVVELMSIVAGLEIRRRKRTRQPAGFVYLVFFCAVLISLAAQVAKAHPSAWGWIMAALPALGFLAVVKIVLTRQPIGTGPDRTDAEDTGPAQVPDQTRDLNNWPSTGALASPQWSGPDRTAAAEITDTSNASNEPAGLDMRVPRLTPAERTDSSTADLAQHAMIDESHRTNGSGLDRSAGGPPLRDQRLNDQDADGAGIGSTEPQNPRSEPQSSPVGNRSADDVSGPVRGGTARDVFGPARRSGQDPDLLKLGRTIAAKVARRKGKLTRQVLIDEIRSEGRTIGTDRASELLQWLKEVEVPSAISA